MDRTHKNKIVDFKTTVKSAEVIIELQNLMENLEVELWSFDRRKALFEEVFGKEIKVVSPAN